MKKCYTCRFEEVYPDDTPCNQCILHDKWEGRLNHFSCKKCYNKNSLNEFPCDECLVQVKNATINHYISKEKGMRIVNGNKNCDNCEFMIYGKNKCDKCIITKTGYSNWKSNEPLKSCDNCLYLNLDNDYQPCESCAVHDDFINWKSINEKGCDNCKHIYSENCRKCLSDKIKTLPYWEVKPIIENDCPTCKFKENTWFDEPCITCNKNTSQKNKHNQTSDNWKPQPTCGTCEFLNTSTSVDPCLNCEKSSNWKPKTNTETYIWSNDEKLKYDECLKGVIITHNQLNQFRKLALDNEIISTSITQYEKDYNNLCNEIMNDYNINMKNENYKLNIRKINEEYQIFMEEI